MREAFSYPVMKGIILWSALHPYGCYRMCLIDNEFNYIPIGDVVDKLLEEWSTMGITRFNDEIGTFNFSGFFGEYMATVTHPNITSIAFFKVSMEGALVDQPQHINLLV